MNDIEHALRTELRDPEYSEGYAESFLNSYVATQIKVIREQRKMTQLDLAHAIGTTQTGISRIENVNYSSWSIRTLIKVARAFKVRLKVSFEPYGTLPEEAARFNRESLERVDRDNDPGLREMNPGEQEVVEELIQRHAEREAEKRQGRNKLVGIGSHGGWNGLAGKLSELTKPPQESLGGNHAASGGF